jgi:quercetin dioxygenase-like cupin family protein
MCGMGAIDIDLQIQHHFSDGVYARQMKLPAGHFAVTHAHTYDHLSILASGEVTVEIDNVKVTYKAPAVITILAGRHHRIEARQDAVWFCIHATDEKDPVRLDEVLIRS